MILVLYIHGKGGNVQEANHYKNLFPNADVVGLDYKSQTPWEAAQEIEKAIKKYAKQYQSIILIANSIGAFFAMNANISSYIKNSYFISPIVNMEKLISDMMIWANVTEKELKEKGTIHTAFGEDLSWEYLCYVREHPIQWNVKTDILYGEKDNLTSYQTISDFAKFNNMSLTVMENGEHWFHTKEQMTFLDNWLSKFLI